MTTQHHNWFNQALSRLSAPAPASHSSNVRRLSSHAAWVSTHGPGVSPYGAAGPRNGSGVLQQLLLQNPDPHFVQSDLRDGFLDLRVFGGGTGFGGLEQVVQAGEFIDFEVLVA